MTAALLAGLAVWLVVAPGARLARLRSAQAEPRLRRLRWLWRGRGGVSARKRVVAGAGAGSVVVIALGDLGAWTWAAAALVAAGVAVGLGWLEPAGRRRRRERLVADLPQALDLLAACLDAGLPVRLALSEVLAVLDGPLAEDLAQVLRRVEVGESDADAWLVLRPHPVLGPLGRDVARSVASGTGLGAVLERHAADARAEHRSAVQVRAKAVGVRSVAPMMACFLPAFLLVGVVPIIASALIRMLA